MSPDEFKAVQFAETFKKFQITANPTRLEHFFNRKDGSEELCEFFCDYITEDNYIQKDLQKAYEDNYIQKDLQKAYEYFERRGSIVADELELENLFQTEYEGFFEIDDEELLILEEELEGEEECMDHYEKLLENICVNNSEIDNQCLNGEIDKLVVTFNAATEENENFAQSLIRRKSLLKQRLSEFIEEYSKISVPLMEHSVKNFENNYEYFIENLNSYLKNGFSHSLCNNDDLNKKIMKLTLFDLKTCLADSYNQEIIKACETYFLTTKKNALYRYAASTIPQDQLDAAISRLKVEELLFRQNLNEDSVESWCTKLAETNLTDFYIKFNKSNHKNLVALKNQVDGILENIIHFRNLCQFYQLYLKDVIETAGKHKTYCYDISDEIEDSDTKLSNGVIQLNHLIQEYNGMDEKDVILRNNFIQELARLMEFGENFEITSLTQKKQDIEAELEALHKSLFHREYETFRQNIDPVVVNLISLFKNLQSNCTSQMMCWDLNIIHLSFQAEELYNNEVEKYQKFFAECNNQKLSDSEKKTERLFWVWFLKNPKKLFKFLKHMKNRVDDNI